MNLPDSRYFRIGSEWMFDTEKGIGYKVGASTHSGRRAKAVTRPEELAVVKAFTLKDGGGAMRFMPVPVGVIRKAEDIQKRLKVSRADRP